MMSIYFGLSLLGGLDGTSAAADPDGTPALAGLTDQDVSALDNLLNGLPHQPVSAALWRRGASVLRSTDKNDNGGSCHAAQHQAHRF